MQIPLLKTLAGERVVLVGAKRKRFSFLYHGITRFVDAKGQTLGLVIDRKTLDEIEEDLEARTPEFLASLEASRKSGRVSAATVKQKTRLA